MAKLTPVPAFTSTTAKCCHLKDYLLHCFNASRSCHSLSQCSLVHLNPLSYCQYLSSLRPTYFYTEAYAGFAQTPNILILTGYPSVANCLPSRTHNANPYIPLFYRHNTEPISWPLAIIISRFCRAIFSEDPSSSKFPINQPDFQRTDDESAALWKSRDLNFKHPSDGIYFLPVDSLSWF